MTADKLADGITRALQPDVQAKVKVLSEQIQAEDGAQRAAEQFHELQPIKEMSCFLCPDRVAVLRVRRTNIKLSPLATGVLFKNRLLKPADGKM